MDNTNWLKQTSEPLFPDLLWSRPENKAARGKLLVIGGNSHAFAAPGNAYSAAIKAGIGSCRVVMPQTLFKTLHQLFPDAIFAPSTPSGSFGKQALDTLLEEATWAEGILLAGDFGRNSETAILLESLLDKHSGQITLAGDGVDYFQDKNTSGLHRDNTLYVINLGKLQKLAKNNRPTTPVLHNMNLQELVTLMADWTNGSSASFITKHADNLIVAADGRVSTTPHKTESINWQTDLAAYASVWWLQSPTNMFEAMTTAAFEYSKT